MWSFPYKKQGNLKDGYFQFQRYGLKTVGLTTSQLEQPYMELQQVLKQELFCTVILILLGRQCPAVRYHACRAQEQGTLVIPTWSQKVPAEITVPWLPIESLGSRVHLSACTNCMCMSQLLRNKLEHTGQYYSVYYEELHPIQLAFDCSCPHPAGRI